MLQTGLASPWLLKQLLSIMRERTIRAIADKAHNRIAIHDVESGDLLHVFRCEKELAKLTPQQLQEQESEAIRDFILNGHHPDPDPEPGW